MLDQFRSIGGDPELLMPVVGVQKEYLETALGEVKERYTTIDGYFSQGNGDGWRRLSRPERPGPGHLP